MVFLLPKGPRRYILSKLVLVWAFSDVQQDSSSVSFVQVYFWYFVVCNVSEVRPLDARIAFAALTASSHGKYSTNLIIIWSIMSYCLIYVLCDKRVQCCVYRYRSAVRESRRNFCDWTTPKPCWPTVDFPSRDAIWLRWNCPISTQDSARSYMKAWKTNAKSWCSDVKY